MPHELALSQSEIQELRAAGYTVERTADTAGFIWRNPGSGASQLNATKQPSRHSEAQAWHDCSIYVSPDGPDTLRFDWIQP